MSPQQEIGHRPRCKSCSYLVISITLLPYPTTKVISTPAWLDAGPFGSLSRQRLLRCRSVPASLPTATGHATDFGRKQAGIRTSQFGVTKHFPCGHPSKCHRGGDWSPAPLQEAVSGLILSDSFPLRSHDYISAAIWEARVGEILKEADRPGRQASATRRPKESLGGIITAYGAA
jgi:hypothetical protein